jgi:hypothetical protein
MNCHLLLSIAAGLAPAYAETIADRWDLAEIYPSTAAWNADASKVDAQLKDPPDARAIWEKALRDSSNASTSRPT